MQSRLLPIALVIVAFGVAGCPENKPAPPPPADDPPAKSAKPAATTLSTVRAPGPDFERFAMPKVQGLVVGAGAAAPFYAEITGGTSPRYWTPEKGQLVDLETRLPGYLRAKAPPGSGPRKDLASYRRQYVGIERDGRSYIFVNAFCETNRRDWTRKPIVVEDGGDCYFQVEFDPDRRRFERLVIQKGS